MSFILGIAIFFAVLATLIMLLSYRFRYLQNAALYLPQLPPDSRINCPSPSPQNGISHFEMLQIPTRDGIMLRGFVVRPAAISPTSIEKARQVMMSNRDLSTIVARRGGGGNEAATTTTQNGTTSIPIPSGVDHNNTSSLDEATNNNSSVGNNVAAPDTSDTEAGVIVYFHGNAGNVGHRLPIAYYLMKATKCSVVMVDYRGYGKSDDPPYGFTPAGTLTTRQSINNIIQRRRSRQAQQEASEPSTVDAFKELAAESAYRGVTEQGLQLDAEAVMAYVTSTPLSSVYNTRNFTKNSGFPHPHGKVFVMGTSLGGAVTSYISTHRYFKDKVRGVILENTFMSISEMVDEIILKILRPLPPQVTAPSLQSPTQPMATIVRSTGASTAPAPATNASQSNVRTLSSVTTTDPAANPSSASVSQRPPSTANTTVLGTILASARTNGSCLNNTIVFLLLKFFKPLILFIGWDSGKRIATLETPTLFLSGRKDEIVPCSQMDRLFAVAKKIHMKRFASFPDGMHNDLPAKEGYFATINKFITDVLAAEPLLQSVNNNNMNAVGNSVTPSEQSSNGLVNQRHNTAQHNNNIRMAGNVGQSRLLGSGNGPHSGAGGGSTSNTNANELVGHVNNNNATNTAAVQASQQQLPSESFLSTPSQPVDITMPNSSAHTTTATHSYYVNTATTGPTQRSLSSGNNSNSNREQNNAMRKHRPHSQDGPHSQQVGVSHHGNSRGTKINDSGSEDDQLLIRP